MTDCGLWAGWQRDGGHHPRSPLSHGLGSGSLPPTAWAPTPFPAKDDGSVALGFLVSLEGRRAGLSTWDSALCPQRRRRELSTGDAVQQAPRPTRRVHWLIMDLCIDLVFPLLQVNGGGH